MYPKFRSSSKRPRRILSSSSTVAAAPKIYVSKGKRPQSTDLETSQVPRCRNFTADAPKTSEYAYFKRFKEDLGGVGYRSLNKSSDYLKSSNTNGQGSGSTISANKFEDLRRNILSSFQAKEREQAVQTTFLSPSRVDANNYVLENRKDKLPDIKHGSLGHSGDTSNANQDVFPFPFANAEISGNDNADDGVFSAKRQKLRQLVADSLRDVDGLNINSKGFDLISTLLNRLVPRDDENKSCWHLEFKEGILDIDHHPPASPEPDTLEKSCTLYTNRSPCGSFHNDGFPAPWSGRPRDRVLAECDIIASGLCQTNYDLATLQNKEGGLFRGFDNENTVKSFCGDSDFSVTQSFEKLHSSGLHVRELDGFYDHDEPSSRVEPYNLLLSLDDQEDKVNPHTTWRNVGHYQTMHDTLDAFTRPSLWSVSSRDFHSFLGFRSTDAHAHELWRNQEDGYSIQVAEQFPLHLPSPSRYFTLENDIDIYSHLNNSTKDLPFVDSPQCTSLIMNKEGDFDAHLVSRGLDIDLGSECFPFIDYISNDPFSHQMLHLPWKKDLMSVSSDDKESILYGSKCQEAHLMLSYNESDTPDWSSASPDAAVNKVVGNSLLLDYPRRIYYELFPDDDN